MKHTAVIEKENGVICSFCGRHQDYVTYMYGSTPRPKDGTII